MEMKVFEIAALLTGFSVLCFVFGFDFMRGDRSVLGGMLYKYDSIFDFAAQISPSLMKYIPEEKMSGTSERLLWAGSPMGLDAETFVGIKVILGALGGVFGACLMVVGLPMIFVPALMVAMFFFPDLLLSDRIKKRQWEITYNMPEMIGMISKSMRRGVEFGIAFEATAEMFTGVLGEEMSETWRQMATAKSRRDAFKGLAFRTGVPTMRRFCDMVVAGEERGNDQLSSQLDTMGDDAINALLKSAEESARKKPTIMLLPIFVLILIPTLIMIMYPQFATLGEML